MAERIDQETELRSVLEALEGTANPFAEHEAAAQLDQLASRVGEAGDVPGLALKTEQLAFSLMVGPPGSQRQGNRYGPSYMIEDSLTREQVDYWEERSRECPHALMRFRYSDLVWVFSSRTRGRGAGLEIANILVDAAVDVGRRRLHPWPIEVVKHLSRALSIAGSIRDPVRVRAVQETLTGFMMEQCPDGAPGAWASAFEALLGSSLPPDLEARAVADIEARLERLTTSSEDGGTHREWAEHAAVGLARYHSRAGQQVEVDRVLRALTDAHLRGGDSLAFASAVRLGRLYELLCRFQSQEEAERIEPFLRRLQERSVGEMQVISHKVEIPRDQMESYLSELAAGSLTEALHRVAAHFIHTRQEAAELERKLREVAPLASLLTTEVLRADGRVAAKVGPLDDDPEGRLMHRISQDMQFKVPFLAQVLERLRAEKGLGREALIAHLFTCPLFEEDRRPLLAKGVAAYLWGDHDAAVHLLTPQIEAAVRKLVELSGGPVYRLRQGRQNLRTLDDLLRDRRVVSALGEDAVFYLRILLTDPRGWNLRNEVAHGLRNEYDERHSDRIVHALLVVASVRRAE